MTSNLNVKEFLDRLLESKEKIDKLIEECLEINDILAKFAFNTKNYKFESKNRKI